MISHRHVTAIGKAVRHASRLRGGSGSALPGLVVEKIDPNFAARALESLPHGVVVISGTNGKTTTTKIVCHLLRKAGLKVFTNKSGSNFTRGIIASLLAEVDSLGVLDADIAVLELDEAYAVHFVKRIQPRYTLLLNVMRDQLDRFGEIDSTAQMLKKVARATTDTVVLNRDDPLIRALADDLPDTRTVYYGVDASLHRHFPHDQQLYDTDTTKSQDSETKADVLLTKFDQDNAWFALEDARPNKVQMHLSGVYNLQNAAGALCLVRQIVENTPRKTLLDALSEVRPAFGRGEAISVNGKPLEIVLVKNPSGFRLALKSYSHAKVATMIAINDHYADGRDMSWLWDVDFSMLNKVRLVSGIRAYDMALRLQYDEVVIEDVEPHLGKAVRRFLSGPAKPRRIFCTYTAMMQIRKILAKQYHLEDIDA